MRRSTDPVHPRQLGANSVKVGAVRLPGGRLRISVPDMAPLRPIVAGTGAPTDSAGMIALCLQHHIEATTSPLRLINSKGMKTAPYLRRSGGPPAGTFHWCGFLRRGCGGCRLLDQVPARLAPPSGLADRAAKGIHAPRDLRVGHERGLLGAQVTREGSMELVPVEEKESVDRSQDRWLRPAGREAVDERVHRFACVGRLNDYKSGLAASMQRSAVGPARP